MIDRKPDRYAVMWRSVLDRKSDTTSEYFDTEEMAELHMRDLVSDVLKGVERNIVSVSLHRLWKGEIDFDHDEVVWKFEYVGPL